jgi:hypothetical protein
MTAWTKEDRDFLEAECERGELTLQQIGKHLGRGKDSIGSAIRDFGLKKAVKPRFWTPERCDELRRLWPTMGTTALGVHFGVTRQSIQAKAGLLDLVAHRGTPGMIMRAAERESLCCKQCGIRLEYAPGCPRERCAYYAAPEMPAPRTLAGVSVVVP